MITVPLTYSLVLHSQTKYLVELLQFWDVYVLKGIRYSAYI